MVYHQNAYGVIYNAHESEYTVTVTIAQHQLLVCSTWLPQTGILLDRHMYDAFRLLRLPPLFPSNCSHNSIHTLHQLQPNGSMLGRILSLLVCRRVHAMTGYMGFMDERLYLPSFGRTRERITVHRVQTNTVHHVNG